MINGRNKDFAWSMTIALSDSMDIWEEEVNKDFTKYLVDGEWRDLVKVTEKIKISGKEPIDFVSIRTHRGALVDYETLKFDKLLPNTVIFADKWYSLAWPGMQPGDNNLELISNLGNINSVRESF